MSDLQEELKKKYPPQPAEIWWVRDPEVRLHSNNRQDKNYRPVLIVSHPALTLSGASVINVVPISSSVKPDKLFFPIARAFHGTKENESIKPGSCAIIQFYQPIELKHFDQKKGKIEQETYEAIQFILCTEVIGYINFETNV